VRHRHRQKCCDECHGDQKPEQAKLLRVTKLRHSLSFGLTKPAQP
jgi:hypothetical protein